jgi:hypothetical protein
MSDNNMIDNTVYNEINIADDNFTVTVPPEEFENYKIDISNYPSSILTGYNTASWGTLNSTIGANGSTGSYYGNTNYTFSNITSSSAKNGLHVTSDAVFEGDVKIKGVSIVDAFDKINKRLAILVPDPAKLEHFEALKRAYENYKTLEALCELPTNDD